MAHTLACSGELQLTEGRGLNHPAWAEAHASTLKACATSARGEQFHEFEVTRDPLALQQLVEVYRSRVTPTLVVDGQVLIGFAPDQLEELPAESRQTAARKASAPASGAPWLAAEPPR